MGRRPMPTDKNAMALYVRVVESGSFSKAAVREGVPVSTVSRKIADLEKSLGVRLLERSTRQLRMTEIGQEYFERCRRGLTELEAADALVTDRQNEISGRLRISIPPSLSDIVIVPLVNAFQTLHPKVVVHCLVTERHVDHIADGIDLSLRGGDHKEPRREHRDDSPPHARRIAWLSGEHRKPVASTRNSAPRADRLFALGAAGAMDLELR